MRTIFEYPLTGSKEISMPECAKILTAQIQGNEIMLWAEVETDNFLEIRYIEIYSTGFKITETRGFKHRYIATVQDGVSVWHIYEKLLPTET